MFSPFASAPLQSRDARTFFFSSATLACERSVSSHSGPASWDSLRYSIFRCTVRDHMFHDGSYCALLSARTVFLLYVQAERVSCLPPFWHLNDPHGIKFVGHYWNLSQSLRNSAYVYDCLWSNSFFLKKKMVKSGKRKVKASTPITWKS